MLESIPSLKFSVYCINGVARLSLFMQYANYNYVGNRASYIQIIIYCKNSILHLQYHARVKYIPYNFLLSFVSFN